MSKSRNGENPRSVALVGPQGSGKSTLFDALMEAAGAAVKRPADPRNRPRPRRSALGHCSYLDEAWSILDCPGSIEFAHEVHAALAMVDIAVVVCEPDPARANAIAPLLRALAQRAGAAYRADQQNRHVRRLGRRRHRGVAGLRRLAAGAAPDADHGGRPHRRLCRSDERACVPLSQRPGVGTDPHSGFRARRGSRRTRPAGGNVGRS